MGTTSTKPDEYIEGEKESWVDILALQVCVWFIMTIENLLTLGIDRQILKSE
jgi:hypothetical protein